MIAVRDFYARYIAICNSRRFELLGEFVAEDVRVDGKVRGLEGYIADIKNTVAIFPDYHWELRHLAVDGEWIAAHLLDSGTQALAFRDVAPAGHRFVAPEFAFYRVLKRRIVEVWGRADERAMIEQLRGPA
jgi:predicted ester cyclase